MSAIPIVELVAVSKTFPSRRRAGLFQRPRRPHFYAVRQVSLTVRRGEVVGIVGESGCGKSTLGRIVAGILRPDEGKLLYRGEDASHLSRESAGAYAREVQMVFQNPYSSLNPRMRAEEIIGEAPVFHRLWRSRDAADRIDEIMLRVGINPAYKRRYPHQFSGGERQRISIGRALAMNPELIVCDEAVAALDVSIQAQVLNLLERLREEFGLAYLFISHDLGVIHHIADHVAVMYLGQIVEYAPTEELYGAPNHPYTRVLLEQMPRLDRRRRTFAPIRGEIPSPANLPSGCPFHTRCPEAFARCEQDRPLLRAVGPRRTTACHLMDVEAG